MEIFFEDKAKEDIQYWYKYNQKIYNRIVEIIENTSINPFKGIGKPEPLKYSLSGYWSRRINQEHRIIYRIENQKIIIISCKKHY